MSGAVPNKRGRRCVLRCEEFTRSHNFPKDEHGRNMWKKILGLHFVPKTAAVCDRHFSPSMKISSLGTKLTPWAIPDMNLPELPEAESIKIRLEAEEARKLNESLVNGLNSKNGEQNNISENGNNSYTEDIMYADDQLDFEDMIDSQTNENNNSKDKGVSIEDGEFEEVFGEHDLDELLHSETSSQNMENGNDLSDMDTMSASPEPIEINSTFKRRLIACVRKRRILYDPAHPHFGNIDRKTRAWERIGKIQKLNGSACRELWLQIRYNYQNHVRSLRSWLAGESHQRERPRLQFENDLIFLWRFIEDNCDDIEDICNTSSGNINDVNCEVNTSSTNETPYEDDEKTKLFVEKLIESVSAYLEIYDSKHGNYGNAKRRSVIWEAISNEIKERPTKCLFAWIQLCLRYEFELLQNKTTYLTQKMKFLEKHIIMNEKSPFKRSTWLRDEWVDPLYKTDEQHLLIAAMITCKKTRPYFANIDCPFATNDLLKVSHWHVVAKARKLKPVKCEVTWIILQMMYCELSDYRRNNCRLRDEWELESVITNLRDTIVKNKPNRSTVGAVESGVKAKSTEAFVNNTVCDDYNYQDDIIIHDEDSQCSNLYSTQAQMTASPPSPPQPRPPAAPAVKAAQSAQPAQVAQPTQPAEAAQPAPPKNEVIFKIPGKNPGDEERVVHYKLDTPLSELPESVVIDISSVLPNAHIVIITRCKTESKVSLFTFERRRELIGEVMARPIIFNEPCKTSRITRMFMSEVAKDLGYPVDVCLSFWEFIVEKGLFIDYDPSWRKSTVSKWIPAPYPIFDKFIKYAETKNWNEQVSVIADFVQEIGNFPLIYQDLKINSSWNRRQCYIRDISEVWAILARKFVILENHKLIWDKFKQMFLLYMSEMELSMYNPWPRFWAPVFEKMKYLFDYKYSPTKPIHYVIRIKLKEEIALCRQNAGLTREELDSVTNAKVIFRLLKENEYLEDFTWVNRARFIAKMKSFPMLYNINHPLFGDKEAKLDAWQEMALLFHCTVGECHLIFQHLMKSYLIFRARDPNQVCRVNAKYWENMTYIYSCAMPNSVDPKTITGRSFRTSSNGSTIKLAEEYQAEISLVDAKPRLILKNFAAAIDSLPEQLQTSVSQHLKYIFSEYTRTHTEEIVVDI